MGEGEEPTSGLHEYTNLPLETTMSELSAADQEYLNSFPSQREGVEAVN